MLDTRRTVETPEGVDLDLALAGPAARVLAWGLDALIRGVAYIGLLIPLSMLGDAGAGVFLLSMFVGEWFYPVLFEVKGNGATPGKRALGLLVMHDDGTPVGWSASLLRNLLRAADFLPLAYGCGIASMLLRRDCKRLGDLAAGTVVVHWQEREPPPAELPRAEPLLPPVPLAADEQRALVAFAQRLPTWSEGRAQELAAIAAPLTGAAGREGVRRLLGMAAWVLGRR
jgi:uncharacterized RDD family membrane protein YckC